MKYIINAACGCHTGRIRKNNEDNFSLHGSCLEREHDGLKKPMTLKKKLWGRLFLGVFDGMGGESFGEWASHAAAQQMGQAVSSLTERLTPMDAFLDRLVNRLNEAVREVQRQQCTEHMGSTMALLGFEGLYVWACNVGDSRIYRFRDGDLRQLSTDHVEKRPGKRKAPLTQYLGFDTEQMLLEPSVVTLPVCEGDVFLLCSDGLTDMLTDPEIGDILAEYSDPGSAVSALIHAALEHGGRDNVTVIVCKLS